ncbi:hypothetical protein KIM67_01080 [Flagellimonas sp. 389]|uniref:hypothetical protein n=1 Tax=Flagellimonas sp. 389 TaxID=2835862 RepID=UPI001BD38D5D|nr:hypothetical protein [Flagellimonas sp. 389]MBS9460984.1 hypothetical protein [Flagellimonas sp. 389]
MDYKVDISKEAQIELGFADCFFRTKNLEREFLKGFGKQLQFLKTTPQSFQIKYQSIRILQFEKFNYAIHYVIKNNNVLILRILNQRKSF